MEKEIEKRKEGSIEGQIPPTEPKEIKEEKIQIEQKEPSRKELFKSLSERIRGDIIFQDDEDFQIHLNVQNFELFKDKIPFAIVQPLSTVDICHTLQFAHQQKIPFSIKAGGSSLTGNALVKDGILIDMQRMKSIRVDSRNKEVTVEPGVTLKELEKETSYFDLILPGCSYREIGVSGSALHGGFGFLSRKYGLTTDNLISVDLVLPNGKVLYVDDKIKETKELMYGIKGAGSSFGIVTNIRLKLVQIPKDVYGGYLIFDSTKMTELFNLWRKVIKQYYNIRDFSTSYTILLKDKKVIIFLCHLTNFKIGEEIANNFIQAGGNPIQNTCKVYSFSEFNSLIESMEISHQNPVNRWTSKSFQMSDLSDGFYNVIKGLEPPKDTKNPQITLELWGGAINDKQAVTSSIPNRGCDFVMLLKCGWEEVQNLEKFYWMNYVKSEFTQMSKYKSDFACYESQPSYRDEKLYQLKSKYDPQNEITGEIKLLQK